MLVNYGRQGMYLQAGTKVECRYCTHYEPPKPGERLAFCPHRGWRVEPTGNCTHFWREVGTDDE
jgi:hypothetical protein